MSDFSVDEYQRLLALARDAEDEQERGRTLEALMCYLLSAVPGLAVIATDVRTQAEEVDIVAHNSRKDPAFEHWEPVVFVECKNWSRPVGKSELTDFISDLRTRGLRLGILVSRSGVTGDQRGYRDATLVLREAMREGFRIVVVTLDDLRDLNGAADFSNLVIDRYTKLFLFRLK